jgi:hypothetical protein
MKEGQSAENRARFAKNHIRKIQVKTAVSSAYHQLHHTDRRNWFNLEGVYFEGVYLDRFNLEILGSARFHAETVCATTFPFRPANNREQFVKVIRVDFT